jgi:hypothetical protein
MEVPATRSTGISRQPVHIERVIAGAWIRMLLWLRNSNPFGFHHNFIIYENGIFKPQISDGESTLSLSSQLDRIPFIDLSLEIAKSTPLLETCWINAYPTLNRSRYHSGAGKLEPTPQVGASVERNKLRYSLLIFPHSIA